MTRKSKPSRACAMCKFHKYVGNSNKGKNHRQRRADLSYQEQRSQ